MKLVGTSGPPGAFKPRATAARRVAGPRILAALAVALLVAVCVAGCGNSGTSGTSGSSESSVLRVGLASEPVSSDPAKASSDGISVSILFSLAYAPIFHYTPEGKVEPALATSWHYVNSGGNEPNTVFEFTLRKGAAFSDGAPVNASAVVNWLEYFTHSTGPFSGILGEGPKFSAVNSQTVRITLAAPNPTLPWALSDGGPNIGFVLGPKAIANPKVLAKETDGAGPYMIDPSRSVRGSHFTYVANPHFYDPKEVKFHEADVKIISESASRLQTQETGQIDVGEGDPGTVGAAESAGLEVVSAPNEVAYLTLDLVHHLAPALNDPRVRQAINLAIDRKSITEALFPHETGSPTSSFIPSDVNTGLEEYWPYEPAKAKKLLKEAGFEHGLTLKAIVAGAFGGNSGEPLVRAVAKNLEEVGIKLEITPYATEAEYSEAVFSFKAPVARVGQEISNTPTIWSIYLAPGAPVNFYGEDPQMNKDYEEGLVATDPSASWQKMWQRFTSQAYVVPLVANTVTYYVSSSVGGVELSKNRSLALASEWFPK